MLPIEVTPNWFEANPMQYANELLNDRQGTHGDFEVNATVAQTIKAAYRMAPGWANLSPVQREALDLIATKIGRALAGDPEYLDHWDDMAGYLDLVRERIRALTKQTPPPTPQELALDAEQFLAQVKGGMDDV